VTTLENFKCQWIKCGGMWQHTRRTFSSSYKLFHTISCRSVGQLYFCHLVFGCSQGVIASHPPPFLRHERERCISVYPFHAWCALQSRSDLLTISKTCSPLTDWLWKHEQAERESFRTENQQMRRDLPGAKVACFFICTQRKNMYGLNALKTMSHAA